MVVISTQKLKQLMAEKIVKASNTNGLKQRILNIISDEYKHRTFNNFETMNAINAVHRTRFSIKEGSSKELRPCFKYKVVRHIKANASKVKYKLELLNANLIFHAY